MKRKHLTKKLVLSKETVVTLTDTEAQQIAGGIVIVANPVIETVQPVPPQPKTIGCPYSTRYTCVYAICGTQPVTWCP